MSKSRPYHSRRRGSGYKEPPARATVHLGPSVREALTGWQPMLESTSGALNTIAARYLAVLRRHLPDWNELQWLAVCDALNGVWLREPNQTAVIWAEVADADELDGLGDKWGVDAQTLSRELRAGGFEMQLAVADFVERFWARQGEPRKILAGLLGQDEDEPTLSASEGRKKTPSTKNQSRNRAVGPKRKVANRKTASKKKATKKKTAKKKAAQKRRPASASQ